jgi:hypothetical protein
VLPAETDSELPLLSRIDWYADVQFTSNEVAGLLDELDTLMTREIAPVDRPYVKELRAFVSHCATKPRCRLTFYGD